MNVNQSNFLTHSFCWHSKHYPIKGVLQLFESKIKLYMCFLTNIFEIKSNCFLNKNVLSDWWSRLNFGVIHWRVPINSLNHNFTKTVYSIKYGLVYPIYVTIFFLKFNNQCPWYCCFVMYTNQWNKLLQRYLGLCKEINQSNSSLQCFWTSNYYHKLEWPKFYKYWKINIDFYPFFSSCQRPAKTVAGFCSKVGN